MLLDPARRVLARVDSHALAPLVVAVGALIGCSSAIAAPTPRAPTRHALAPSYLFSIPTASGSLRGRNDQHLTLRLRGTRDYLTRFTDRPLRQANVVANVDFARRFESYFAESAPNAVLTYTPRRTHVPVSIVLTISTPHWNPKHSTWTFRATRIRKKSDTLAGSTGHIKPPLIPNPHSFRDGTLLIDDTVGGCELEPSSVCEAASLAGVDLQGLDLHEINLTGADLTGANLAGANLAGAILDGANLTGANLTDVIFTGAELESTNFTNATIQGTDLSGVELYNDNLTRTNLSGDNLTAALLNYAILDDTNLSRANLREATFIGTALAGTNFSDANLTGVNFTWVLVERSVNTDGATFCDTTWMDGSVLGGFTCPAS